MAGEEEQLKSLQDAIYREKVERARRMTVSDRLAAGLELSEEAMGRMKMGVRMRNPGADESEINRLLIEEMDRLRKWKERELYKLLPAAP